LKNKIFRILFVAITGILLLSGGTVSWFIFGPQVRTTDHKSVSLDLPTGSSFEAVFDTLQNHDLIRHPVIFRLLAARKHYPAHIRSGHYNITDKTSYNSLINLLRAGRQVPVTVTFTHQRSVGQMAGVISRQLEFDSIALMKLIRDPEICRDLGFDTLTLPVIFIPNTYEFYWNTSALGFLKRMKQEYDKFWIPERRKAAEEIGLTPVKVVILASIVEEETWHPDEMPAIAGVYLNRLKKGIRLQADPTIKYAVGNVSKHRILTKDLQVDSPYNTYRHAGLPPGPITIPSVQAIDAVLNADKHQYLYFCAKDDFSGYHYFSRTLREHNRYAYRYRQALNKNKVYH